MGKHDDRERADALTQAWNDAMEAEPAGAPKRRHRLMGRSPRTRSVLLATGLLVVTASPFAVAATGDALREGQRNGTATRETQIISSEAATTARTGGFATRQSNLSNSGGGAIYGCRSTAGGTAANPPKNPCIRANNLSNGFAFEFNAVSGVSAGLITAGSGGDSRKPFTTNATGVATGLNADRVDGLSGEQITGAIAALGGAVQNAPAAIAAATERFVTVRQQDDDTGAEIVAQSGGFTLVNCYEANSNCYISAGSDVTNRAITTEILTDNTVDPGDQAAPEGLTGTTSAAPCFADYVTCGPPNTDSSGTGAGGNNGVFVVTPRNTDGTSPPAGDRYGFTAVISASTSAAAPNDDNFAD